LGLSYYDLKAETPEAYPVFESVLKEFLFDLPDRGGDDPLLPRIFSFLEEMANSHDKEVINLLWIAILEPLVFQRDRVRRAWKYKGSKTKELARETARSGSWLENLPPEKAMAGMKSESLASDTLPKSNERAKTLRQIP
jgi:hypothetical protein